jgi:hypothetical protein
MGEGKSELNIIIEHLAAKERNMKELKIVIEKK